jgi:hypothetical protein
MARLAGMKLSGETNDAASSQNGWRTGVRGREKTLARRAQGLAFAPNRGVCLPGILAIATIPIGSPAMSATYTVFGAVTGESSAVNLQGDAPVSFSQPAGDSAVGGAGFTATTSNLDGGSASVSANMFIGDFTQFSSQFGLQGGGQAKVEYTIRIVGPATNAFIPVHVHNGRLGRRPSDCQRRSEYPGRCADRRRGDCRYALSYANDTLNLPTLPGVVAQTNYDYRLFSSRVSRPPKSSRRPIVSTAQS